LGRGLDLYDSGWKKLKIFWKHKRSLGFKCIGLFLEGLITFYPPNMSVLHTATQYLFYCFIKFYSNLRLFLRQYCHLKINTLRTGDADLRFYITTVQDGWRKSAFLTRVSFSCTIHLIMQYIGPVSEWSCWRMFIENWPHSELTFRHRASFI
jgi:hypothetical protein